MKLTFLTVLIQIILGIKEWKDQSGQSWPRLTKERAKPNWLSVEFSNWRHRKDDSDEDRSSFDRFSEMMNNMGGDVDIGLPE